MDIVATAGMHLDPGDGDDAGQAVKIQYQSRYQTSHESLLSFYNATQLLLRTLVPRLVLNLDRLASIVAIAGI
jgi:hypothetical protein